MRPDHTRAVPSSPFPPRRLLRRNRRRRLIGGVCAGIADYLGVDATLIRLLFVLSVFFSFSVTLWLYLVLWFLLPASPELPIPEDLSWGLARELRRLERKLRKLHRRHDPAVADLAQEAFDALKILAPQLDRPDAALPEGLREAALVRFPRVLDRLVATPASLFGHGHRGPGPGQALVEQLAEFRAQFQQAVQEQMDREFRISARQAPAGSPELAAWRERLQPLQERLKTQAGPAAWQSLQNIEEKLAFLLARLDAGGDTFDLRPFEVRKIAFEYLPDALNQYLQLPPSLARTERLASGKTAEESLTEQLQLLDATLKDLAQSLFQKDAGGLLVHGRFLREKFAEQPFRLAE
ncbi:PspC domain-containing protein [Candidatus Methylocalor cossyra]|uniref:Phage shock protein C (PspC) family protein n=1 Tax=Candidatus Methylocalor cossyra TaxID=3108543 RepID=A0ABM9NGB1_9GAMM